MPIGYLVAEFPKPSETFVSRELLTLQKLGLEIKPFAFEPPSSHEAIKLEPLTLKLLRNVEYLTPSVLLRHSLPSLPGTIRGWSANGQMQADATMKSNRHARLLRVACLARRLEQEGISHLHAHWPYATQVAYQVHKLTGIPFSVSIHAHEVEHDNGHFAPVFETVSFASFCNRAAMERLLHKLPPAARQRSHLIYHGVDLQQFSPIPYPTVSEPLRVLSAGRLTRSKGFDRLLTACAKYHAQGGKVELTILGTGGEGANLQKLADESGFAAQFHLPGWLSHNQVAEQMGRTHLFALMADTNFHDGLPNVVLEAMSSARPVILSPLPAADEAISQGVEGFILKSSSDVDGCVQVLQQVAGDRARMERMGQAARQRMERDFDENIHGTHLMSLFHNAGQKNSVPRPQLAGVLNPATGLS